MGFNLMVNFDRPFSSKSITEFWRRWHISLSTWFYDYLYNPLVASIREWGKSAIVLSLLFSFIISGMWHGAGWKYIIYGLLHCLAITFEYLTKKIRRSIMSILSIQIKNIVSKCLVFIYFSFTMIFFRARDVAEAFVIIKKIGAIPTEIIKVVKTGRISFLNLPGYKVTIIPCIILCIALEMLQYFNAKYNLPENFSKLHPFFRWGTYYFALLLLLFLGVREQHQFIYFKF